MKEHLLNLRDWEAAALNEGRATALVRVCKPQPPAAETIRKMAGIDYGLINPKQGLTWRVSGPVWAVRDVMGIEPEFRCPFGSPGDVILGRESWDGNIDEPSYRATAISDGWLADEVAEHRWRSPVTMPRHAIRARYTNAGVRCMRVQDLTEQDAWDLGFRPMTPNAVESAGSLTNSGRSALQSFLFEFYRDHGPGAWASNPWVFIARLAK